MAETHGLKIILLIFLEKMLFTNSKADASVTCLIPDDCVLPCSFRPTGTVVIHWYKQQIPVHSYYYNKDQFRLQNKHFSGRTCLFNSHIAQGNASLLLRRVKVQDKGRYKCYTSTRKGNQETFVNLEVKALIQSVNIRMTNELVTCSSHNIYPSPRVIWTTDPPSAREALENSTLKTTDHKGLFTVESSLRILGHLSNYTYFCSFVASDRSQVWTASWKSQDDITNKEGQQMSIPCIAPHSLQNFSLTWTFTGSSEPAVIIRYDSKNRHTFNLWEDQAELDQDLLLVGDGSLLLHKPEIEEHSGTYTCTFLGLQSRNIVQTKVNITTVPISQDEESVPRFWWSTAGSAAFFLFTVILALPQCMRQREMGARVASNKYNSASSIEDGLHKGLQAALYTVTPHGVEDIRLHLQVGAQDHLAGNPPSITEGCCVSSPAGT